MFGGIVALEKQLIKVRSEASDSRLDIADVIQTIDVLPALRSVKRNTTESVKLLFVIYFLVHSTRGVYGKKKHPEVHISLS